MLGTGVYLRSALMTQQLGSAPLVLFAWLAAGVLSLLGALTYAELAARLPRTGGEYVFLHQAFGPFAAFLFGWSRTLVGAASQAAVAVAVATFAVAALSLPLWCKPAIAVAAVVALTIVNCAGVVAGAWMQTTLTAIKVLTVTAVIAGALLAAPEASLARLMARVPEEIGAAPGLGAFGVAMIGALWPYAGWNNLPMAAGETVDPSRTIPRAIVAGTAGVTALYLCANAAYFLVLPIETIAASNSTAYPDAPALGVRLVQLALGPAGATLLTAAFAVSAFGTLNGLLLSTARIGFAMARDGLLPNRLAAVGDRSRAPVAALVMLGTATAALAALGTIDRLATSAIVGYWIFHTLCGMALFRLRRQDVRNGRQYRGFRVPLFPLVPGLFVACGAWLVINAIRATPIEARWAFGVVLAGMPAYLLFRRRVA